MAQRKPFLLRIPEELLDELNRWAKDELRSVNAQVEYILREAVRRRHRDRPTPADSDVRDKMHENGISDTDSTED